MYKPQVLKGYTAWGIQCRRDTHNSHQSTGRTVFNVTLVYWAVWTYG